MKIDSTLVQAYLAGEDMDAYKDRWFFTASSVATDLGKNIFTRPPEDADTKKTVAALEARIRRAAQQFSPVNLPIWDALFPGWETVEPTLDLIVGFPEPYEAVTENDPQGQGHMIFDLVCWRDYARQDDLESIIRNLLTHEITHLHIGRYRPGVDADLLSKDYLTCLDAYTFHEGFAHLISYESKEIQQVDWHDERLVRAYASGREKMRLAMAETDSQRQKQYLYDAVCGSYYEKFACMCGMLYLADCWEKEGMDGLKAAFADYHGFARKTLGNGNCP
ncbi:MAG: hypothetical protein PT958_03120 [Firmicutes bacterium]|nr:hypothetical protein [Bacillota bacterium]MDY2719872.1 hypothetical protein [Candidatus Faecousia sp.]